MTPRDRGSPAWTVPGAAAWAATFILLSCGGCGAGPGRGSTVPEGEPGRQVADGARTETGERVGSRHGRGSGSGACPPRPEPTEHPTHRSDELRLEVSRRDTLVSPVIVFVDTVDRVLTPIPFELTVYGPSGSVHEQTVMHKNAVRVCPNCDPVVGGPPDQCDVRCYVDSAGRTRVDLPAGIVTEVGRYTVVAHRPGTGARVSETFVVSGPPADAECAVLPESLGPWRRHECKRAVVPLGVTTLHWGLRARYGRDHCRASVFALRLSDAIRFRFHEGPVGKSETERRERGPVKRVVLEEGLVHAWLGRDHLSLVALGRDVPGGDSLVDAMLETNPPHSGPQRTVPSCDAAGPPLRSTVDASPKEDIRRTSTITPQYEDNTLTGMHLLSITEDGLFDRAGFRPRETLYTVDGDPLRTPSDLERMLDRMSRPGTLRIVAGKDDRYRCLVITLR